MLRKHKRLTKKELKQDALVIFTAQVVDFMRKEWIKISSTFLVVMLVIILSFFMVQGKKKRTINAFDTAFTALKNDAPEALDLLKSVVEKYGGSKRAGEATIKLGNSYFHVKDYDSAERYFNLYIDEYANDQIYIFNAFNSLGGIFEEKGDYLKAGNIYEKYISEYKNSIFLPIMILNAGKAHFLSGNKDEAKRNFLKITNDYKDSKEKQEATFFMELLN
ncbi:tetratricopeptide repeat protein [Candidatus Latescibacterota bacterium]